MKPHLSGCFVASTLVGRGGRVETAVVGTVPRAMGENVHSGTSHLRDLRRTPLSFSFLL